MATVWYRDGTTRQVKNLGWLLRYRSILTDVYFTPATPAGRWPALDNGGTLRAYLDNGTVYQTTFASETVFRQWAMRYLRHWPVTYI